MEYGLVLGWWLLFVGLWLGGLPLAGAVFESVPRRGAGLALPVVLGLLTLVVFWVGHLLPLSVALVVGLAVVGLASVTAWHRGVDVDWRAGGGSLLVFTVAFLFLVAVRAVDPAVNATNGEKFLDFGLLRTLARTRRLPPEDMWFAGEPVRYYYGGHLLVALLGKLTGTASAYAYNLGLAGYYAMLVTAVYELGAAVAAAREESPRVAGVTAAFFVGVASNLYLPVRLGVSALPSPVREDVARVIAARTASLTTARFTRGLETFSFWSASRVIPDTINEFPLFAWLFGDLHAHMMSAPFLVVGAAVCHAYYRAPASALARRRGLVWGVLPLVGALLTVVSTWGTPTLLGLVGLTLLCAPAGPTDLVPGTSTLADRIPAGVRPLLRPGFATLWTVLVAGLVVALAAPFVLSLAAVDDTGRSITLVAPGARTSLLPLVLVHGAFLVVFAAAFLLAPRDRSARRWLAVAGVVGGSALLGWALRTPAIALFLPVLAAGAWRLGGPRDGDFESLLLVAGAGLALLVEWLYVVDPATSGRANTVFKSYAQLWVLWGVAAGVVLPWLVAGGRSSAVALRSRARLAVPPLAPSAPPVDSHAPESHPSWRRVAGVGLALVVVLSTSVYGVVALDRHFDGAANRSDDLRDTAPAVADAPPTLDATRFVSRRHPGEAPAIAWLDARPGTPTIATAPGLAFTNWTSAPSTLTGIPTVAGWTHARLYHGADQYYERAATVDAVYCGSPRAQVAALAATNVSYVYVGASERARYEVRSLARWDGVTVANRSGAATVFRVDQRRLDARPLRRPSRCTYDVTGLEAADGGPAQGRVFRTSPEEGNFSWRGPRMMLPPGRYRVTFQVDASGSTRRPVAFVAVSTNEERTAIARQAVFVNPDPQTVTLTFRLTEGRTAVEFRGFKPHDEGRIRLSDVSLTRRIPANGSFRGVDA